MGERWSVHADDGHEFELLVEAPARPRAAVLFACAMGVEARYYAPFADVPDDWVVTRLRSWRLSWFRR